MTTEELLRQVEILICAAAKSTDSAIAMRYSQAACNAANAIAVVVAHQPRTLTAAAPETRSGNATDLRDR